MRRRSLEQRSRHVTVARTGTRPGALGTQFLLAGGAAVATLLWASALARPAQGQVAPGVPVAPPQILVSARGEVEVTPDRAVVQLGVETQALTAAAASAENNRKQTAVLAAIRALEIPAANIRTLNYTVSPVQRYDDKTRKVVIDGYQVSNIVQVTTDRLEQSGTIIDGALANGANRVVGIEFRVRDASAARDRALSEAVASAKRQAEVAARAAGGQLGELLELSVNEFERPMPRPMLAMARADAAESSTPISEGTMTVAVSVSTRWRFSASPR